MYLELCYDFLFPFLAHICVKMEGKKVRVYFTYPFTLEVGFGMQITLGELGSSVLKDLGPVWIYSRHC